MFIYIHRSSSQITSVDEQKTASLKTVRQIARNYTSFQEKNQQKKKKRRKHTHSSLSSVLFLVFLVKRVDGLVDEENAEEYAVVGALEI